LRNRILEFLLVIFSLCVTALLAEAAFSLVGLPHVPLRMQRDLPQDLRVFAQSSKAGVVPRDPVLLLGDSYAQGFGDWLWENYAHGNGPFHSAHIIKALTGRDVVTLGVGGGGSAEGIAAFPAMAYADARAAWYLRLPPPHVAVIYFYEGNDLNDNLLFLSHRVAAGEAADDPEQVDRALAAYPSVLDPHLGWSRHLPLLRFLWSMAQRRFLKPALGQVIGEAAAAAANETPPPPQPEKANVVEVAGRPVELPAVLQGPALELSDAQMQRGALVYARSLAFLHRLLPDTPVLVVYIPAPMSSYRLLSAQVTIEKYRTDDELGGSYPAARVAEHSDAICLLIRAATVDQHAAFFDLRPAVRAAGSRELLHGPYDFRHFNRKGMELLGREVVQRIDHPPAQEPCSQGAM